jgi:hemolysin activation/secretion protein
MFASILLLAAFCIRAADVPSAGSQLQQVPAAPQAPPNDPDIRVERRDQPTVADDAVDAPTIVVKVIRIAKARRFSEQKLVAATKFKPGESLSLAQLREIAAQVAAYYHQRGYFLAQATLPPQDVKEGVITIAVLEGQYGNVVVRNDSRLSNGLAQALVDDLQSGDAIDIASLESGLLLLSDLPGVEIKSTLTPGASVGAADLIIDVLSGRTITGTIEADNFGNRYTGEYRLGGSVNLNNPFGLGDVASLRVLSSLDGFSYGRAAYQLQIERVSLGASFTALEYELGEEFKSLEAHGTAEITGLYARLPMLRRRSANLSLVANLESKKFRDEMDVISPAIVNRKRTKVAMLSLLGDRKARNEQSNLGSASNLSLTWTTGSLDLLDAQAVNSGAGTATTGHYDKVSLSVAHLKAVAQSLSLYLSVDGQWAADNLDSSEKLSLGGANSVRAFPEGEASVDEGYVVSLEARVPFAIPKIAGRFEAAAFADHGSGNLSVDPAAGQANRRRLSAAGVGLNWSLGRHFYLRANYAHKVGAAVAASAPDSNSRVWVNVVGFY